MWLPGGSSLGLAPCRGAELTERGHLPIQVAAGINAALDLYFPDGCGVEIVARPGRYYVTSAFTFAASVTAMAEVPVDQPGPGSVWDGGTGSCLSPPESSPCSPAEEDSGSKKNLVYHLSDGIYGAFSRLLFDSPCPRPQLHKVRAGPVL